ncbi:MAG: PAS domain-containing protein [Polyangiaceae bacterium]|nr:PAS domain-containing protein [Polyangiaceae bacterium]
MNSLADGQLGAGAANEMPAPDLLDCLTESYAVIDHDFRYVYANEASCRHARCTKADLIGRTMMAAYPGVEQTPAFSLLRRCMVERAPQRIDSEFEFPDGSKRWLELRMQPVPAGVAILSVDIDERKRAEERLRPFSVQLEQVARAVQELSRARSVECIVELVCRAARSLTDSDGAAVAFREGHSCRYLDENAVEPLWKGQQFELEGDVVGFAIEQRQCAFIGDIHTDERFSRDRFRSTFVHSVLVVPLGLDEPVGTVEALWATAHHGSADETGLLRVIANAAYVALENVRVLSELEQGRARARAIHDHLPSAAFLWRRHGDDFVLVDVNVAAEAATRGRARAQLGRGTEAFAQAIRGLREDLTRCSATRTSSAREADCTLPGSAGPRTLALAYGFVPQDMVLLTAEDVTERRRTQEQLWLSQRLEAVGRLAGGVAHDFNNLLSVILGCAEFALGAVDGPMQHDLEEIRKAGERAAILTRQLLAFSRRQVLQPEVTSLNRIVEGMDTLLRRLIGEDVELRLELRSGVGNVKVDPGQIEQVIMNLAINSRDAMPKGGKLTIATSNVDLDEDYVADHVGARIGPHVMLSVSDTGSGMNEETKRHLFEPFFTTKEPGKGTGLGLSTVYGIVKQSGGNVWVYSEQGRGTTFKIYLPRERAVAEPLRPIVQASLRPRGKETVLLVEDDAAVRNVAQRILRSAGYTVLVAGNGAEALGVCKRHPGEIQLVLTDVVMPDMSGRDLVEFLTATRPEVAVLYASGYTDDAIIQHGVLEPGTHFISKPFHAGLLTRKVREVLDRATVERRGLPGLTDTMR